MRLINLFKMSFRNLFRQKMRTSLTIISMMVGAFLIAIMLSVGNGLKQFMISQITLFSNERTIAVRKQVDMGESFGFGFGQGIQEYEDEEVNETGDSAKPSTSENNAEAKSAAERILEESMLESSDLEKIQNLSGVKEAAFETFVNPEFITLQGDDYKKLKVSFYGVPQGFLEMLTFSAHDPSLLQENNAVVLSEGYAESWGISREDLVGKRIIVHVSRIAVAQESLSDFEINGVPFLEDTKDFEYVVAGVFEKNLFSQIGFVTPGISNELNAYLQNIPVETFEENEKAFEIIVLTDTIESVTKVDMKLDELGYDSTITDEAIGQIGVIFDVISAVLSSFGFVAMFVASIGIANTLLMAIYERTREIGVMKAVGATRLSISMLFSAEALWLGLIGGMLGIGFGYIVGSVANYVLHQGVSIGSFQVIDAFLADYPTFDVSVFSLSSILVVMGVTTGVAFIAGLYPSVRAARLDPIVALRHD